MERKIFYVLCVVLLVGMVMSSGDDWGSINTGDNGSVVGNVGVGVKNVSQPNKNFDSVVTAPQSNENKEDGNYFTSEFYIAIGFSVFFLLVLCCFVWLWFRGSKNKWE